MKALLMEEYKKLSFTDVPDPRISAADDILVRVRAAAICGSDVHGFDGSTGRRRPPIVMGHEAAGEVAAVGSGVSKVRVGDRVTLDSTIYCGECFYCGNGRANLCDDRRVIGVSCEEYRRDGAFAEYIAVPQRICHRVPDGLGWEDAAMVEPAAVAAHALRITSVELNETVAVVGAGLIGLLLIDVLRASASGEIVALDTDPSRREAALARGASAAFDPADGDLVKKLHERTSGRGVDRTFEAVGATSSIRTAISVTRKGGSVTLIGNISPTAEIPLQSVVSRQISLLGSCASSGEYPLVLDLMGRGKIDARPLISKIAPLGEGQIWFDRLYAREGNLLKVILVP